MKRKFLEDLGFEKEAIDKIMAENESDVSKVQTEADNLTKERDQLKVDIKDRDKQLNILKSSTGDVEAMKKQISDLQETNKTKAKEYEAELRKRDREAADKDLLTEARAKNQKAVLGMLDAVDDKLDIEAYKVAREAQIKALVEAEDSKFLFSSEADNQTKFKGVKPGEGSDSGGSIDTSKMDYEELEAYLSENPDATL